jgi:hypothetical protein
MNNLIADYINSIKMTTPGCPDKDNCVHFYRELKLGDDFIKGEFCIRFENWPNETVKEICNGEKCYSGFMDKNKVPDNYAIAILRRREFSPGVLDLDTIFGGY